MIKAKTPIISLQVKAIIPHHIPKVQELAEKINPKFSRTQTVSEFKSTPDINYSLVDFIFYLNFIESVQQQVLFIITNQLPFKEGIVLKVNNESLIVDLIKYDTTFENVVLFEVKFYKTYL